MDRIKISNKTEIGAMFDRIKQALGNDFVRKETLINYTSALQSLGVARPEEMANDIILALESSLDPLETERDIRERFKKTITSKGPLYEVLKSELKRRLEKIYFQLAPHIRHLKGLPVVDWGCGNGQLSVQLKKGLGLDMYGFDVLDFRSPGTQDVNFLKFDGKHTGMDDGFFKGGIVINVLHHSDENQIILEELARIIEVGGTLVINESVPASHQQQSHDITFMADYFGNRLFWDLGIPVPGTYEVAEDWEKRLNEVGFVTKASIPLGVDHELFPIEHHLLVMKKVQ